MLSRDMGIKYTNCVCFDCKTTARRVWLSEPATCPTCRKKMDMLHYDVMLPKKQDKRGWKKLQEFLAAEKKKQEDEALQRKLALAKWEREFKKGKNKGINNV